GAPITPAVQVTAQDAQGNTATQFAANVTVALGTNPGGGALSGTTTVAAAGGVATFAGLSINRPGTGYTLAAATNGIATKLSTAFNVAAGTATQLVFTVQPSAVTAGAAITPPVQVTAEDALGNTDPGFTANVVVTLGANPGGGTLSGTTTVAATNGVATFAGLSIDKAAAGYALAGSSGALTGAASSLFNVTASTVSAAQSTVSASSPIIASSGSSHSTITVTARDQFANPIQGATVTLTATPTPGNTLTQPLGTTDAGGVATGSLSSTAAGLKTVSATVNAVAITQTATVVVNAGTVSASQSTVSETWPTGVGSGSTTLRVTARDANGNPIQGATVVLATTGSGNTLTQPAATTNASGVATGTLSSTLAESKTISATINAVAITQTATVVVNAGAVSASQSTMSATSPITAGSGTSTITVTARDASGNLVQGATVVLAATGTGNTLTQPTAPTNASGLATGTLGSTVAESKTVSATIDGVVVTQTATVVVDVGAATKLAFATPPSSVAQSGVQLPQQPVLHVQDANSNPVSGSGVVVTATVTPAGATPSNTTATTGAGGA